MNDPNRGIIDEEDEREFIRADRFCKIRFASVKPQSYPEGWNNPWECKEDPNGPWHTFRKALCKYYKLDPETNLPEIPDSSK